MRDQRHNKRDRSEPPQPDRNEAAVRNLGDQFSKFLGINMPAVSKETPLKLDKYQKEALYLEILESIDALHFSKKPYFGKKIKHESELPIPDEIEREASIVNRNGHNIIHIIDHLLIANAVGALSAVGTVSSLYPASSKESAIEYRKALRDINIQLMRPENANSQKMFAIKAEAQEIAAELFKHRASLLQLFSKADYKFMPKNGHVLMLSPDLTLGKSIAFAVGDVKLTVVSEDFWTTEVFAQIGSIPGRNNKRPNLTTYGYSVTRVADKLDDSYKVVHINGRIFEREYGHTTLLTNIAKNMKEGASMIFEFDSWPQGRQTAIKNTNSMFFEYLINRLGFDVEIKLGRSAYTDTNGPLGKVFHPAAYGEKDYLIFTKRALSDPQAPIKILKRALLHLSDLAKFKDSKHFDTMSAAMNAISSLEVIQSGKLKSLMAQIAPRLLEETERVSAEGMQKAAKHLRHGNIEGFVEEFQNAQKPKKQ